MNKRQIGKYGFYFLLLLFFILLIKCYLVTFVLVEQDSMLPTLKQGDILLLNKWSVITKEEFTRGEIILFATPSFVKGECLEVLDSYLPVAVYQEKSATRLEKFFSQIFGLQEDNYIKRIIGIPGDEIEIKQQKVYLNGEELIEPYLQFNEQTKSSQFVKLKVPQNTLFVMGDNREHSTDSRDFGCIPMEKVKGKVVGK